MSRFRRINPLYLPLILAPIALLSPVLFAGKAMFWGTPFLQFIPWRWAAWEMLRSGHLPLWNPQVGMGAPLAANYQSALFYPPNWISFLLAAVGGVGWLAWGQALLVALHLIWAGLGMSLLARQMGLGGLAQAVSGLAFGLSGYLVSRSGFLSINAAAAWVPWVILLVANRSLSSFLKLSAVLAMQLLAGHAQTFWYTLLLAGMWTAFGAAAQPPVPLRDPARQMCRGSQAVLRVFAAWLRLGLALAFALALAAVQLLPTAEYLQQSQRAVLIGYDFAVTYSYWPWRVLTLLAPDMFGSPVRGDYWGYGNYWEDALYIGMLPVLMAIGAVFRALKDKTAGRRLQTAGREQRITARFRGFSSPGHPPALSRSSSAWVPFLIAIILLSFALALGKNTAFFPWLYRHIPTFDMFQAPTRFSLWAGFALALLAGIGVDAWRRPEGRGVYWTRLGTAGAFAVTLGTGVAWLFLGDISPTFLRAAALSGMWAVGFCLLSLLAPQVDGGSKQDRWIWAVILFVCADLLSAGWGLVPGTDLALYTQPSPNAAAARSLAGDSRVYLPGEDEYELKFDRFFRFKSFDPGEDWGNLRAVILPDAHLLDGLHSVNNFDPLVPGRYASWMEALEKADPQSQQRLLNLMDVGVVVKVDPMRETGVRLDVHQGGQRLRWVPCVHSSSNPSDSLAKILSGRIDPEIEAIVEGPEAGQGPACPAGGYSKPSSRTGIQLTSAEPDRLQIRTNAGAEGWLVLSDVWYPGWQARVDGKSAPILRADYLFRAVPVPAGEHEVIFVYRPVSFYLGVLVSLAAWVGLAFLGVRRVSESTVRSIAASLPQ